MGFELFEAFGEILHFCGVDRVDLGGGYDALEVEGASLDEFEEVGERTDFGGEEEDGEVVIRDETFRWPGETASYPVKKPSPDDGKNEA